MELKKRKIIFDVDTGSDDALALMVGILSQNLIKASIVKKPIFTITKSVYPTIKI